MHARMHDVGVSVFLCFFLLFFCCCVFELIRGESAETEIHIYVEKRITFGGHIQQKDNGAGGAGEG